MNPTKYLRWQEAGGPNECAHGYARGIPCPTCDGVIFNVAGSPLVQIPQSDYERLLEVAEAARAVVENGWTDDAAFWLRRAVCELDPERRVSSQ